MKKLILVYLFLVQLAIDARAVSSNELRPDLEALESMISKIEFALGPIQTITQDQTQMIRTQDTLLKLGDLYADKARALLQNAKESNLKESIQLSQNENRKALKVYESLLTVLKNSAQEGYIRLQMSQQYMALNQERKALDVIWSFALSSQIKKSTPSVQDEINFRLGALLENDAKWAEALPFYKKSENSSLTSIKIQSKYRMTWTLFNLNQVHASYAKLVETTELTAKDQYRLYSSDDLLGDLIKVGSLSQKPQTLIAFIEKLDNEDQRLSWIQKLVAELNNKARYQESLEVIQSHKALYTKNNKEFDYYYDMLMIQFGLAKKNQIADNYSSLLKTSSADISLNNTEKSEEADRLKQIDQKIRRWVQEETNQLSAELIATLKVHVQYRPDLKLSQFVSQKLQAQNKNKESYWFFETTLKTYQKVSDQEKKSFVNLEDFLKAKIETAESLPTVSEKRQSYLDYLQYFPQGSVSSDARYQLAHIEYKNKNWNEALKQFQAIITNTKEKSSIRIMSAHLYLDVLAQLQKPVDIAEKSRSFMTLIPEETKNFQPIEYKALQKIVFDDKMLGLGKSDSLSTLNRSIAINLSNDSYYKSLSEKEKTEFLKQILFQFNRLEMYSDLKTAALQLLKKSDLKSKALLQERQLLAYTALVQVLTYEKDYKAALKAHKQIELLKGADYEHLVQQAGFETLAKVSSLKTYERIISEAKTNTLRTQWAYTFFNKTENKISAFKKYKNLLQANPSAYQNVLVIIYAHAKVKKDSSLQKMAIRESSTSSLIHTELMNQKTVEIANEFKQVRYQAHKPATWASTYKKHEKLLKQLDKQAQNAVNKQNSLAQIFSLRQMALAKEWSVQSFLNLPAPRELTAEQKKNFSKAREQKLKPDLEYLAQLKKQVEKLESDWSKMAADANLEKQMTELDQVSFHFTSEVLKTSFKESRVLSIEKWIERTSQSRRKWASQAE